jgi:phosphate transport system ATP-binding protein
VAPDVLLLDEPTSSLDPVSTEAVEALLLRLAAKVSMVIVTHNLAQARRIADQIAFFYEGRLVEAGPTEAVFESPKRRETGKYLQGQFG